MKELNDDDMFSSDLEQEANRFDKKPKRKTPVVINISDDERATTRATTRSSRGLKKKTLNVKQAKAVKKAPVKAKDSCDVDFTINLSPALKRSKTIMPKATPQKLELKETQSK